MTITNPDETGDWLYVKDAVKAILNFWEADRAPQRIYNIAGGVHSIREVVQIARRYCPDDRVALVEDGANQSPYPAVYDDTPAREQWGWMPDYSIESAVREHLEIISGQRRVQDDLRK